MTQAYPLQWPAGRPRTSPSDQEWSRFDVSPERALREMIVEVERMGGTDLVISTNVELRRDGLPYANRRPTGDTGVAVYFKRKGELVTFSCDRYYKIWENMRAIGKTIEAMRAIERWGAHEVLDQMFRGFTALPAPDVIEMGPGQLPRPWNEILGVAADAPWSEVRSAYRDLMRDASDEEKTAINVAYDQAKSRP